MPLLTHVIRRLQTGRTFAEIQLLSRPGCHLCEDAERALKRRFGATQVQVVNILEDRELEDLYVFRIPVVLYEGDVIAEGQIGDAEARRAHREIRIRQRNGHAPR